jgi:glycosyltransferase involved in cell wall biosynthesis
MKITVLIPAYMPDKTLIDLAKELSGKGFSILVVDDGSGADFDGIFRETKEFAELVRLE